MKKVLFTLLLACGTMAAQAQRFVIVNGKAYSVGDIEKFTYVANPNYQTLADALQADSSISISGQPCARGIP